jgi:hypothetical protein
LVDDHAVSAVVGDDDLGGDRVGLVLDVEDTEGPSSGIPPMPG